MSDNYQEQPPWKPRHPLTPEQRAELHARFKAAVDRLPKRAPQEPDPELPPKPSAVVPAWAGHLITTLWWWLVTVLISAVTSVLGKGLTPLWAYVQGFVLAVLLIGLFVVLTAMTVFHTLRISRNGKGVQVYDDETEQSSYLHHVRVWAWRDGYDPTEPMPILRSEFWSWRRGLVWACLKATWTVPVKVTFDRWWTSPSVNYRHCTCEHGPAPCPEHYKGT